MIEVVVRKPLTKLPSSGDKMAPETRLAAKASMVRDFMVVV